MRWRYCMHGCKVQSAPTTTVSCISSLHAYSYIQQGGRSVKTMNAKNTKKLPIHENADANITCDFGDGDISRLGIGCHTHGHIVSSIIVRLLFTVIEPSYLWFFVFQHGCHGWDAATVSRGLDPPTDHPGGSSVHSRLEDPWGSSNEEWQPGMSSEIGCEQLFQSHLTHSDFYIYPSRKPHVVLVLSKTFVHISNLVQGIGIQLYESDWAE